jgi:hypothetical protein
MGFTQIDGVIFLLCGRQFDFVGVARGSIAITDWVIQFGGRSSMQALILCRANICGIRSNPEGYVVHTLHLDRAESRRWCVLPQSVQPGERSVSGGAKMLPERLTMN